MSGILVIPCYNEAARLDPRAFDQFLGDNPSFGVLLVDDGSTDSTLSVLNELHERWGDRCRLLPLPQNRGKGEAVRAGMLACREAGPAYVGFFDADLATPLAEAVEMRALLAARPGLALVMAARVQLLGRRIDRKATRHYLGRVFATAVSLTLGLPVYDTQCGAKLFRATDETWTVLELPFGSRWIFDVELLARMMHYRSSRGLPDLTNAVYEHDLEEWTDVDGSKLKLSDFARAVPELIRIRRRWLRGT